MGRKYIRLLLLIFGLSVSFGSSAQELDSIKDYIFKDCPSAMQEASSLNPEVTRNLIEYLIRVLEIQKDSPRPKIYEPATAIPQPGYLANNPANTLRRLELLKAYEPERDEEAKDCAIELLKSLVPYSFEAIPRLIELCATGTNDQLHKDKIRKLIWQLALATKSASEYQLPANTVSDIAQTAFSNEGYLADNILYELSPETLKIIATELKKPNRPKRHNNIKLLLRLDPGGDTIGPLLIPYLNSSDDNLRLETALLLGKLKNIYPKALQPIIDATNDTSIEVANAAYQSLADILSDINLVTSYPNKDALFAALISNLESAMADRRDLVKTSLNELVNHTTNPIPQVISLLHDKEDDIKLQGLNLARILKNKDINLLNAAQDLLYNPSFPIRSEAIAALAQFGEPLAKDAAKALTRLLKTLSKEPYSSTKEELILNIIQAATNLPTKYSENFQSYFVEALGYRALGLIDPDHGEQNLHDTKHPAVLAFLHLGEKGIPTLLKALKTKNDTVKMRALYALQKLAPSSPEAIKQITALLKDPNIQIRAEAQNTLVSIGDKAKPELQKALAFSDLNARYSAAKALLDLGDASPMVTLVLMEGLKQENCRDKSYIGAALKKSNITIKAEIEDQLVSCLQNPGQEKDYILEAVTELSPLEQQTLTKIASAIVEKRFADDLILSLGEKGEKFGLSRINLVTALRGYLSNPNNTNKARAIEALGGFGEDARVALPEILAIFNDQNQEDLIRHKALIAVTKIEPSNAFFKKFLSDELLSEKSPFALTALSEMAPSLSLPLIVEVYDRLHEETKINALKVFENYPDEAKKFDNFVIKQLYAPNPLIRVHSLAIILKANITCPELITSLRTELIGKYSGRLADNLPPEPLTTLLQEIISAPLSRAELKNAETLLSKLNHQLRDGN